MRKEYIYILCAYLAIAFSGIHFFQKPIPQILFVVASVFIVNIKYYTDTKFLVITAVFIYVVVAQSIVFEKFSLYETLSIYVSSIVISFIIIVYFKKDFPKYYVKALFLLSVISLCFYTLSVASSTFLDILWQIPRTYEFLDSHSRNNQFILHSVSDASEPLFGLLRHNGAFHEPGVFGLFLIIGLYFNYLVNNKILNKYGIIFIICIVTTFSTAAYIGFFIFILGFSLVQDKIRYVRIPIAMLIILLSINMFYELDFMYNKIIYEYQRDTEKSMFEVTGGRIYGMRKSLYVLEKYPFAGRGLSPIVRETNPFSPEFIRYGLMHEIAKIGLLVGFLYMYYLFKGIRQYGRLYNDNNMSLYFIPALLINMLSQSFAFSPVLMNFVLFGILYDNSVKGETKLNYE